MRLRVWIGSENILFTYSEMRVWIVNENPNYAFIFELRMNYSKL